MNVGHGYLKNVRRTPVQLRFFNCGVGRTSRRLSYNDWRLTPDTPDNGRMVLHNCYFNKLIFTALDRREPRRGGSPSSTATSDVLRLTAILPS